MSPLEAIGYALAALIALPVAIHLIAIAAMIIAAVAALGFVVVVESADWVSRKWRNWKARK